jgi:hypothetical protein
MAINALRACSKRSILILALVLVPAGKLFAQESPFNAAMKTNLIEPGTASSYIQPSYVQPTVGREREHHRFWDRDNSILFAAVGASAAADFCVTRANLASGGRELNPVTRIFSGSTTGLAFNFIGETAGSIGVSYLFHKTGHHRLERLTSFVEIGASTGAVGYGLTHR